MKVASKIYMGIVYLLLYAPIVVIAIFSFNSGESTSVMEGFSFQWYAELFKKPDLFDALKNSLLLALTSALIATVIGTLAAVGLSRMRTKWLKAR